MYIFSYLYLFVGIDVFCYVYTGFYIYIYIYVYVYIPSENMMYKNRTSAFLAQSAQLINLSLLNPYYLIIYRMILQHRRYNN